LELWYTKYSNRGLITDKQIKTFKIYHQGVPVETVNVLFKKEFDTDSFQEDDEQDAILINQINNEEEKLIKHSLLSDNNAQPTQRSRWQQCCLFSWCS
jgi:hypothetical protein